MNAVAKIFERLPTDVDNMVEILLIMMTVHVRISTSESTCVFARNLSSSLFSCLSVKHDTMHGIVFSVCNLRVASESVRPWIKCGYILLEISDLLNGPINLGRYISKRNLTCLSGSLKLWVIRSLKPTGKVFVSEVRSKTIAKNGTSLCDALKFMPIGLAVLLMLCVINNFIISQSSE